jgi:Na+-driven multidrug efflux pump
MWISILWQWVFFMPLAFVVGPLLGFGLLGVWLLNAVYRVGQAVVCAQQWAGRKWANIEI